jgi:acetyl esterase/lipase
MLSKSMIDRAVDIYLAGADPTHPYASPCRGDFSGLPPLLVTVSEEECLRDDAYRVVHGARQAGVTVELLSRPDMPHIWPVFHLLLPEARQDMHVLVNFVERHVGDGRPKNRGKRLRSPENKSASKALVD